MCSNEDLLANLHLSEVIHGVQDHHVPIQDHFPVQEGRSGAIRPPAHQDKAHSVSQKDKDATDGHLHRKSHGSSGFADPPTQPGAASPLRSESLQETVKYGELVLLGYNGSLPDGTEKGRRRSKYVLNRRPQPNGVRVARYVPAADPAASAAVLDASQHSIAYTLSRHQAVVVLYERDPSTDMFQVGRSKESQIDFVVMDTPPPPPAAVPPGSKSSLISEDSGVQQATAHQHELEQHLNLRHSFPQHQGQVQRNNGEFRSGISRYACRLIVERQPIAKARRTETKRRREEERGSGEIGRPGSGEADATDRELNSASELVDLADAVDNWTVRVFAAGFDASSNIFLGENASAWQGAGGAIDGLTTNGVLLMQPAGEFGQLATDTGLHDGRGERSGGNAGGGSSGTAGVWREVSVAGGIYGLRESRAARRAGPRIAEEDNVLCDGALIDLCGATLLFRSAKGLANSPTRAELLEQVARLNAGRPQCPVGLNTLVVPSRATLSNRDQERQPYVYLHCGHVQGLHAWGKANGGSANANGSSDWRKCPMCLTCGPVARLAMGIEPAFCVDRGPPAWAFRPCGHMASEGTVKYWAAVPTPHGSQGLNAICPFCAARLCDSPGYVRLIFQDNID